ncbi:MAG TPA: gliding motility-associated C-terminal domain-containing protein [Haliscomenobacter sp.]|uniref:gliding motility-associated C-terminal domain-containing protein n=1 Tax=Haliscomenobacter sp. TaxID=2717303 RepID=UPI002C0B7A2D|nr:gliding motility-associated C-terminal domain-containing protein [Haliscomenobacter sp.]HOY19271.1 gliding motility-associated C-terminal domain-containing protein [Haliscomenobacter sp.]
MKTKTTFFSFLFVLIFLTTATTAPNYPHTENTNTCACEIYVPNVFSPNGDSKNDVFKAVPGTSCSLSQFSLKVFDRFGAMVFETSSTDEGWDGSFKGQNAPSATYIYVVQYELNEDTKKLPKVNSGSVALIR